MERVVSHDWVDARDAHLVRPVNGPSGAWSNPAPHAILSRMDLINETLETRFGFSEFREGQEAIVRLLVGGSSAAAVFPTGAGKSLCYQLPALLLPGITLVISPLIALMKDQIDQLRHRGIEAARLDSSLSLDEYRAAMFGIREGRIKLVYVSPERFNNERFRETLRSLRISLMAVDEAHCISEWGHNFRPDYLKLPKYAEMFGVERILALTATATPSVLDDICEAFSIDPACSVRTEFYRPNLHLHTSEVHSADRDQVLITRLREAEGPVIVYVTLVRTAEILAAKLAEAGMDARAYHAQLKAEQRHAIQEWFTASDSAVVVATIAFGMGIDKSDIRSVIHYNLPKSLENYAQEIGRSGRDGESARCEMFVCAEDLSVLENFIYGDTPGEESVRTFVEDLFNRGESFELTGRELSTTHDIRPLVVQTLLTYLELEGYFEVGTPIYSIFQFEPHVRSEEILDQVDGADREFVKNVLLGARKARRWFRIDVDATAARLHCARQRVIRTLDHLAERGWINLQGKSVLHPYRTLRVPDDTTSLSRELSQRMLEREQRDLSRLRQVLELAAEEACRPALLSDHFGEPLEQPCGNCSWCESKQVVRLDDGARRTRPINPDLWRESMDMRRLEVEALGDDRSFARWLCGLTSPRLTSAKLTRHRLFGCCDEVPFEMVLSKIRSDQ